MTEKKLLFISILVMIFLAGCATGVKNATNNSTDQSNPVATSQVTDSTSSSSVNTYPIVTPAQTAVDLTYPSPGSAINPSNLNSDHFVDQLIVPEPSSGNGVIIGTLLVNGDETQPFLTTLYLASITSAASENHPPTVYFSIKNDPIATQEKSTGRFMFGDVIPGQYALVISTPGETSIVPDENGNTLVVDVKSNEVTDLGVIPVQ
jgi:hypothetical protein